MPGGPHEANQPSILRGDRPLPASMEVLKSANVASIRINWKALGVDPKIMVENSERIRGRFIPTAELRDERVALVAYGPSLKDTWDQIRDFDIVFTCSGAHKFLLERGITPTFHCESDPRGHKVKMLGPVSRRTTYLMASCCHSNYFDALIAANASIQLWHVLFDEDELYALYPKGDWVICGGNTIGPRMIRLARLMGFTDLHIFGLDGSGAHAGHHTNAPTHDLYGPITVKGQEFNTTKQLMYQAVSLFEDLDRMPEVKATFYGDGMYQTMYRDRERRNLPRWPLAIQK